LFPFTLGDLHYKQFYDQVLRDSSLLTEEPQLPRRRQRPLRFSDGFTIIDAPDTIEHLYKQQYFQAIDIVMQTLKSRFKQPAFLILSQVERFILNVANKPIDLISNEIDQIHDFLNNDVDIDTLKREAIMISDHFGSINVRNKLNIKRITRVSTVCDLMNESIAGKTMFPEYDKLLRLYLSIPVTTASAERAFSTLNRLKTCLRSSIGQARLNHCLIGHIYKEQLDHINPITICSSFVKANARRQAFFGCFP
jgi:hypothetical protein